MIRRDAQNRPVGEAAGYVARLLQQRCGVADALAFAGFQRLPYLLAVGMILQSSRARLGIV